MRWMKHSHVVFEVLNNGRRGLFYHSITFSNHSNGCIYDLSLNGVLPLVRATATKYTPQPLKTFTRMLARYVGKACWQGMLARYVGKACWQGMLARHFGKACWQGMLARHVGKVCWQGMLARYVGRLIFHPNHDLTANKQTVGPIRANSSNHTQVDKDRPPANFHRNRQRR